MSILDRLETYLIRMNCWFEHDQHELAYTAREVAHVEHVPEKTFAKSVIVHSETGFAMCVLPADLMVDLEQLRVTFEFNRLRLATETEMAELFPGCELGAMPPFGNGAIFDIPVFADAHLLRVADLSFNAGTHRDVIRMKTQEWQALVKPSIVELTK